MSFFSDLFEGNFSNLGTDITHAPSSLAAHPDQLAETLGGAALLTGGALLGPDLIAGLGAGAADVGAGAAADAGAGTLATDLGIADIGVADAGAGAADLTAANAAFGAFDPTAFAAQTADLGLGVGGDVLSAGAGDFASLGPQVTADLPSGASVDAGADLGAGSADLSAPPTEALPPGAPANAAASTVATPTGAGATTTPAGMAPTDAELSGGITGTTPAAAGGGGISSLVQGAGGWGNIAKWGLAGVPLALTLGMGEQQLPSSAQALQAQALQMQQTGLTNLAQAQAGVLNAGQTSQLAQMRQDQTNSWKQTLFNQGVTDVTKDARWPQIEAAIDANVTTATANLIQQNITNALAETGQASSALTSIAQMQMTADQNFTNNLIGATKSLGLAAGLSSAQKITIG
jgi:hypothetical protein